MRRNRRNRQSEPDDLSAISEAEQSGLPVCALCQRQIPPGVPQSRHHLVPKHRGGKGGPVVVLHAICHRVIHATLTESELAQDSATPEALRAHPSLATFAAWVALRPVQFNARVPGNRRVSRRRG